MRVVMQRAASAHVCVDGETVGRIGPGLLLLLGVTHTDTASQAALLANKAARLRIFCDDEGKMNRSLLDVGGQALVVSNFTLYADASHGRRPSFISAARPQQANELYECFCDALRTEGVARVETGCFGADMRITLEADGPVTITLDSEIYRRADHVGGI